MPKKKNPHKHTPSGINPKARLALEANFRKENENARIAGKEYGTLAMGLIALMATVAESEASKMRTYMIDASEVLSAKFHIPLDEIIALVNTKMGSEVTKEQIIEIDPSFSQFF